MASCTVKHKMRHERRDKTVRGKMRHEKKDKAAVVYF